MRWDKDYVKEAAGNGLDMKMPGQLSGLLREQRHRYS